MISESIIQDIIRLKRKCEDDCGVGTWCTCGANTDGKLIDIIVENIRNENEKENHNG